MPLFPRLIQSLAICINFFSVLASNTHSQDPPPAVVLEATSVLRGIGGYEKEHLLSRLERRQGGVGQVCSKQVGTADKFRDFRESVGDSAEARFSR